MVVAIGRLNQSLDDDDDEVGLEIDEYRVADLLERLRQCRCSTSSSRQNITIGADAELVYWTAAGIASSSISSDASFSSTATAAVAERRLANGLELISLLPLPTCTVAVSDTADVMSPALVIDRCPRPAFDSASSSSSSAAIVHHEQHRYVVVTPSSSFQTRHGPDAAPRQSRPAPEVVACSSSMSASDVVSSSSFPVQFEPPSPSLPLHDSLSRFRAYRRSTTGVGDSSMTSSSSPSSLSSISCCLLKIRGGQSNAPDDEVRDLLETGNSFAGDSIGSSSCDPRKESTDAESSPWSSTASAPVTVRGGWTAVHGPPRASDVDDDDEEMMTPEFETKTGVTGRCRHGGDGDQWIDAATSLRDPVQLAQMPTAGCVVRQQRQHWTGSSATTAAVGSIAVAMVQAAATACVQRPSLDFDKMQRTCFRRQRVYNGAIRKPRIVTLKNSGWSSPIKHHLASSSTFDPAVFSFRSLASSSSSSAWSDGGDTVRSSSKSAIGSSSSSR